MMISLFGIGAAVGGAMGGVFGQKMYNKKPQYLSLFMGVAQMFSVPLMWRIIDAEYTSVNLTINVLVILFAGCIASMAGTNVRFLLINVNGSGKMHTTLTLIDFECVLCVLFVSVVPLLLALGLTLALSSFTLFLLHKTHVVLSCQYLMSSTT